MAKEGYKPELIQNSTIMVFDLYRYRCFILKSCRYRQKILYLHMKSALKLADRPRI